MKNAARLSVIAFLASVTLAFAQKVERHSFPPPPDMLRADVVSIETVRHPKAVLVLCPGCNGSGEGMIRQAAWLDFAKQNDLGLIGLHFESPLPSLNNNQGYYLVQNGSGAVLLAAIRKIYGRELPVLLYGFSGGSHYTLGFVAWKPEAVIGFSAHGGIQNAPVGSAYNPPGILSCGDEDRRIGGALTYFKQARVLGKPWLWVEVPRLSHSFSPAFEKFLRCYFAVLLNDRVAYGVWVDIDRLEIVDPPVAAKTPTLSGWLPDRSLFEIWKEIQKP